jgi:hypothetical protein
MTSTFLAVSAVAVVVIGGILLISRRARSEPAGWAGLLVSVVGLGVSIFFGIQAHEDSTKAAAPPASVQPARGDGSGSRKVVEATGGATSGGVLPSGMAGTWEGVISQPNALDQKSYTVRLTLRDGDLGQVVGTSRYASLNCGGILTLRSVDPDVRVDEDVTGGTCVAQDQLGLQILDGKLYFACYVQDRKVAWAVLTRRS